MSPLRAATRCKSAAADGICGAARFNYASTAIALLLRGVAELSPELHAQSPVRLGQKLAALG